MHFSCWPGQSHLILLESWCHFLGQTFLDILPTPQARLSLQRCNHRAPCTFLHHICHNWNSLYQLSVYVCLFSSLDTKFQAHWPCYHHISASCQVCDQKASHPSLAPERSPNPMKMSYKEDKKFLSHETLVQH